MSNQRQGVEENFDTTTGGYNFKNYLNQNIAFPS